MIGAMATIPRTEHAVARSLAETVDPRDALRRALRAIGESLDWEFGAVWEPGVDRPQTLHCIETWQATGASDAFASLSRATVLTGGGGLPGRVWLSGEPAWITDIHVDSNFPRAPAARRDGLRSGF